MKRLLLILLAVAMPLCVAAQRHTDATLLGHVVDSKTGEHVPYINVYLEGTSVGTATDEGGHFNINNCPVGEYTLVVRGVGYRQNRQTITLERNKTLELNIVLEPDAIELGQVVVTASQHASSRTEAPAVVGVVSAGKMESVSAANLAEGMRFETGVRVENTCQNCGSNEMRINGLGGAYSQVLIDSRPVNSSLAGVYLLEQLPASMIEQVEVMRGGGSALYGSSAIAGVVNVITREPVRNTATVSNITRLVGGRSVDWSNQFGASVVSDNRKAGIYVFGHNRQRDPYDHDGDGYSELGLLKARMVGFRGYVRTGQFGKLNVEYHNISDFRRGGDRFDLPSPQAHISEGAEHDINSASLKWDWLSRSGLRHASFFASMQHVDRQSYYGERADDEPFGNAYGYTEDLTLNYGTQYSRHFDRLWFMPAELTAGVEHTLDRLDDRTLAPADSMSQRVGVLSGYVQNEWRSYRWSLLIGARADKHSMLAAPVVSPRVNVRFAPQEHLVLRAGYASGFRAPQVYDEDLHVGAVNGELYRITNADSLRKERSNSLTASADWCFHLGGLEADLLVEGFYTRIDDAFVNELLFDDTLSGYRHYERRNADGAVVKGVNAELRLTPVEKVQLQLGGTWQSSRYTGQGQEWAEGRYERRMERCPDLYAYLTGQYTPIDRLDLMVSGVFTGPMLVYHNVDDDVFQVTTPSFFDLTVKVAYSIPFGRNTALELNAGVQNVLDSFQRDFDSGPERDSQYIYGPSLPRTFFAGARLAL